MSTLTLTPQSTCNSDRIIEPAPLDGDPLPIFKALADGSRLAILRLIAAQSEPLCACEIAGRFDLSQPTIAHHLRVLRETGLITADRRGVWVYYAVDQAGFGAVARFLGGLSPIIAPAMLAS